MTQKKPPLTEKQRAQMPLWRDRWFNIGADTTPADRPRAERAIRGLYRMAKEPKPDFVWADSPRHANRLIAHHMGPDQHSRVAQSGPVYPTFWAQQEAYWIAFYLFCRDVVGVVYDAHSNEILDLHAECAQSCGWWWGYRNLVVVSDRPVEIHWDNDKKRLHRDGGPAVLFRDGWSIYQLHGVGVPRWLAELRDTEINPRRLLQLRNAQVRAEFVRKIGMARICAALGAKAIDKVGNYELLLLEVGPDKRRRPYLKMQNPSVPELWHVEGVPPYCKTVRDALEFRNGRSDAPEFLS